MAVGPSVAQLYGRVNMRDKKPYQAEFLVGFSNKPLRHSSYALFFPYFRKIEN